MKFVYLVLHYKNIADTTKCVKSIFSTTNQADIVIVDNGSKDGTGQQLKILYKENDRITILISEENLGFSKGNNLGYTYIRNNMNADFVIISNNDVVFYQDDFEEKIKRSYQDTHFYVLGPDVYVPSTKGHQNPLFVKPMTLVQLENDREVYRKYLDNPKGYLRRKRIRNIKNKLCTKYTWFRKIYNSFRQKTDVDYTLHYENVGLQGSCIIISKKYLCEEEKMFTPEPFLYCEEWFLYYKCNLKNYKVVYCPEIGIRHEERGSVKKATNGDPVKQVNFILPYAVEARNMLIEYIKENHLDAN